MEKYLNEAIIGIIEAGKNINYQIYWATGNKQYDIVNKQLKDKKIDIENISNCKIVPYIYNMEEAENIADAIVARSGAMTVTEIANLSKASVLIPLPSISNNRQIDNAKVLENLNAAKIIENNNLTANNLNEAIEQIVLDKEKCIDCDNCIIFCPDSSVNKQHDINYDYCKGCGICAHECPSDAIEMIKE